MLVDYIYANNANFSWYFQEVSNSITSEKVNNSINSSATYQNNGNFLESITDARGNKTLFNYDTTKGLLSKTTDAKLNETSYSYNSLNDQLTSVSKGGISNQYSYINNRLSTITHNGFNYGFEYDEFGNSKKVNVGTQTLIENQYEANNGNLLKSVYGNTNSVGYTYDKNDQVIEKKYNDAVKFTYKYDKLGNLAQSQDLVNGITSTYQYDLTKRLLGIRSSNNQTINFNFDAKNRLAAVNNSVNSTKTTTNYTYNTSNLINEVSTVQGANTLKQQYSFDDLSRLNQKTVQTNSGNQFITNYSYSSGQKTITTPTDYEKVSDRTFMGDFNGDGKQDMAVLYDCGNFQTKIYVWLSNCTSYGNAQLWCDTGVNSFDVQKANGRIVAGDFNGDGKCDIAALYDYGNNKLKVLTFISTGTSFSNWAIWRDTGSFNLASVTGRL